MTSEKTVLVQTRVTEREHKLLSKVASERGTSLAGLVRDLLITDLGNSFFEAFALKRGDSGWKDYASGTKRAHYRLYGKIDGKRIVARVHALHVQGDSYPGPASAAALADRDWFNKPDEHWLVLRGSGPYRIINTVERTSQLGRPFVEIALEKEEGAATTVGT